MSERTYPADVNPSHVLVVSGSASVAGALSGLLQSEGAVSITTAANGNQARGLLAQREFALVIVNAPLEDEFGHELALLAANRFLSGVMLLVKTDAAGEIAQRMERSGVMVVPKPVNRASFFQALKLLQASVSRVHTLQSENRRLQRKIEEIRMVDRAKCALIQYLIMTEPQAHRYIEKQAMDLRVTKMEVAQGILQTYDT